MDIPLRPDVLLVAERSRRVLCKVNTAKAEKRRLPLGRRPASRHQSLHQGAQPGAPPLRLESRSRRNYRRCPSRAPNVGISPLSCSPLQGVGMRNSHPAAFGRNHSTGSTVGQSRRHGLETTVDHALIRGLVTAGPDASRSCLCLETSVGSKSGC